MDFRYYVFKLNKLFTKMLISKILLLLVIIFTIVALIAPITSSSNSLNGLYKLFNPDLSPYIYFNFSGANLNYSIMLLILLLSIFFIWLIDLFFSAGAVKAIKMGSSFRSKDYKKIIYSWFLDIICIGFIIQLIYKKQIIMNVYNDGIDVWFDSSYEQYDQNGQ